MHVVCCSMTKAHLLHTYVLYRMAPGTSLSKHKLRMLFEVLITNLALWTFDPLRQAVVAILGHTTTAVREVKLERLG